MLVWIVIAVVIMSVFNNFVPQQESSTNLSYSEFINQVKNDQIETLWEGNDHFIGIKGFFKKILTKIRKTSKLKDVAIIRTDRLSAQKSGDRNAKDAGIGDVRDPNYQNRLIVDYLERTFALDDNIIKEVLDLHFSKQNLEKWNVVRNDVRAI